MRLYRPEVSAEAIQDSGRRCRARPGSARRTRLLRARRRGARSPPGFQPQPTSSSSAMCWTILAMSMPPLRSRVLDLGADLAERLALPGHLGRGEVPLRIARHAGDIVIGRLVTGGAARPGAPMAVGRRAPPTAVRGHGVALGRPVGARMAVQAARAADHLARLLEQGHRALGRLSAMLGEVGDRAAAVAADRRSRRPPGWRGRADGRPRPGTAPAQVTRIGRRITRSPASPWAGCLAALAQPGQRVGDGRRRSAARRVRPRRWAFSVDGDR